MKRVNNKAVVPLFSQEAALRRKNRPLVFQDNTFSFNSAITLTGSNLNGFLFQPLVAVQQANKQLYLYIALPYIQLISLK